MIIAYKWTIKRLYKYYPLVNFRINGWMNCVNAERYELGKVYDNPKNFNKRPIHNHLLNFEIPGYHSWASPKNKHYELFLKYWKKKFNKDFSITILKIGIEVEDIIKANSERYITRKIKILEEFNAQTESTESVLCAS